MSRWARGEVPEVTEVGPTEGPAEDPTESPAEVTEIPVGICGICGICGIWLTYIHYPGHHSGLVSTIMTILYDY